MTRKKRKQNQQGQNPKTPVVAAPPKSIATTQPTSNRQESREGIGMLNWYHKQEGPVKAAIIAGLFGLVFMVLAGIGYVCQDWVLKAPKLKETIADKDREIASLEAKLAPFIAITSERQYTGTENQQLQQLASDTRKAQSDLDAMKKSTEAVFALITGDELWNQFPFGYVLFFGKHKDRDREVVPLLNRGYEYPVADWKNTEIVLDPKKKTFSYSPVSLSWKKPDGTPGHMTGTGRIGTHSGTYTLGKPVLGGLIHVGGQINPHFEVIDDNPDHQICVIGFTKDE
jgi:hypothetical protein